MERVQVAAGQWVVNYEAGIGGEGYDPPKPERQRPADSETVGHTAIDAATQEEEVE